MNSFPDEISNRTIRISPVDPQATWIRSKVEIPFFAKQGLWTFDAARDPKCLEYDSSHTYMKGDLEFSERFQKF